MTKKEKTRRLVAIRKEIQASMGGRLKFDASGSSNYPCGLTDFDDPEGVSNWGGDYVDWKNVVGMIPENYTIDVYITEIYGVGVDCDSSLVDNAAINIGSDTEPAYWSLTCERKNYLGVTI
jgi:hypothetical protein